MYVYMYIIFSVYRGNIHLDKINWMVLSMIISRLILHTYRHGYSPIMGNDRVCFNYLNYWRSFSFVSDLIEVLNQWQVSYTRISWDGGNPEYALLGWYLAHLQQNRRHHYSLTCLTDRCLNIVNFAVDIAQGFDEVFQHNSLRNPRFVDPRLNIYTSVDDLFRIV